MPLPDERPRQSVANLIGRFEQQGKRQATPAVPAVPRSSSVSSQIAGDSAKEEAKEKREWPPNPPASADIKLVASALSTSPSPSMSKSPVSSPQPTPDIIPPADNPTTPTPTSPQPLKSPPSKGKAVAATKSTPTAGTRRSIASPQKFRSPVANSSSAKSATSSPPKSSLQSSVSQPLKPQHTGHSVVSNPPTIRQARTVPKTAPSTPSRPKSSAGQNQATARPKTPSSGLFAPTAASLARSRNAPPVPPPPIKKVTLSSDAAERLSKPTAASLSKARTPAPSIASPARVAKSTSTSAHVSTLRGSSKSKIGRTPMKPKEANAKEKIKSDPASASSERSRQSDQPVVNRVENGHELETFLDGGSPEVTHGYSEVVSDPAHDPAVLEDLHTGPGVHLEQQESEHPAKEASAHEHVAQDLAEETAQTQEQDQSVHLEDHEDPVFESAESHQGGITSNGDDPQSEPRAPGNEIEDIINLLEGAPLSKPRPQSIVTIPDEHYEY